ncbi:MAG: RNA polymerase factor sigma-54 [Clostridia bacterium]|nr:RNA polymerase factor sigma-54 [Clostridia bacterium]
MKLGYHLNITQTQKLIMTPELRQAINILQLTTLELNNFIEKQLLENPLLDTSDEIQQTISEVSEEGEKFDIDWQEYFADGSDLGYSQQREIKEVLPFENVFIKSTSLEEYLEEQLRFQKLSPEELALAQFIIGNLDSRGYFTLNIQEVALDLGVSPEKFTKILKIVQNLEPDGVASTCLEECLIIQLRKKNQLTPLLENLIKNYLKDIGQGKLTKVADRLAIPVQKLQEQVDFLKTLNPKPAAGFGSNQDTRFITPDIIIEKIENEYIVLVNDVSTPRLMINSLYKEMINNPQADKGTRNFIEKKLHGAIWLIKSIEQRRITLYKIANVLVDLQRGFLDKGRQYLVPLNLKDVAERLDIHESTVSRAIANKYVQTPRGLYPLKFFFSSGVNNVTGKKISAEAIKKNIEDLIATEDPKKPFSDQKICQLLQQKGIKIARRTVGKYREELGIPAAVQRRRY